MSQHKRPTPLRAEATWTAVVVGVGAVGSLVGIEAIPNVTESAKEVIQLLAAGGALAVSPRIAAIRGEKHVTPVDDPKDNKGRRLGVVDDGTPQI